MGMEAIVKADRLESLCRTVAVAAAVEAADQLGVLAALEEGPLDPRELSQRLSLSEEGTGLLVGVLAEMGVLERMESGRFGPTMVYPGSVRSLLDDWRSLPRALREFRTNAEIPGRAGIGPGTRALFSRSAHATAEWLATGLGQVTKRRVCRILVIGGEVIWPLALAERVESCRITVLDASGHLPHSRDTINAAGRGHQVEYREDIPGEIEGVGETSFDLVLLIGVDRRLDFVGEDNVLRRAFRALRPEGRVALVEILGREGPGGSLPLMLYTLELFLHTGQGQTHPFSRYAGWLHDAGFELLEPCLLSEVPPLILMTARRPAV